VPEHGARATLSARRARDAGIIDLDRDAEIRRGRRGVEIRPEADESDDEKAHGAVHTQHNEER
jgi:hypothetical protein